MPQFPMFLNEMPHLQQLLSEPATFWVDMVKRYFADGPHVAVSLTFRFAALNIHIMCMCHRTLRILQVYVYVWGKKIREY